MELPRLRELAGHSINESEKPKWKTRSVEVAINNGFSEFDEFMAKKISASKFAEFISDMSMSQTENSKERKMKSNFITAAEHIVKFISNSDAYSKADIEKIEDAIEELRRS